MEYLLVLILFSISFIIYFFPTFISYSRKRKNKGAILVCNILFGWTLIGWGVTLIWSLTYNPE